MTNLTKTLLKGLILAACTIMPFAATELSAAPAKEQAIANQESKDISWRGWGGGWGYGRGWGAGYYRPYYYNYNYYPYYRPYSYYNYYNW